MTLPRWLGPALLVAAAVVATWLIFGVGLLDIIRFLGYDIAFVALPGMAMLWALRGKRCGLLVTIALGWPLGQTLEILAFSASAATGHRSLFVLYPLIVILLSALLIRRRWRSLQQAADEPGISIAAAWATAVVISLGLLYLTLMLIPQAPLPGNSVPAEYLDFPYFIGLIHQVMNHWPPTSPGLYGTPLHYEWFVLFHIAAAAQVTGLPVPTIALRLAYVPTIVVVACQLLAVGRTIGRSSWTGVTAIAVVFLLGPLDLTTDANGPAFGDNVLVHLWDSWTFPFGLMFLLAILYLLTERLRGDTTTTRQAWSWWGLIVLLMIGASGSKATVLPVIIVGTVLFVVLRALVNRSISIPIVAASVAGVVVFIVTYLVIYGGGAPDTKVEPLAWLAVTPPVIFANLIRHAEIRDVVLPFAYAAGLAGMMLPLAGMLYLLRREHRRELATFALPFCMYVGGVLLALGVHQSSGGELYFQDTGYVAGSIVAAEGFRRAWLDVGRALPCSRGSALAAFAGCVALLIVVVKITSHGVENPGRRDRPLCRDRRRRRDVCGRMGADPASPSPFCGGCHRADSDPHPGCDLAHDTDPGLSDGSRRARRGPAHVGANRSDPGDVERSSLDPRSLVSEHRVRGEQSLARSGCYRREVLLLHGFLRTAGVHRGLRSDPVRHHPGSRKSRGFDLRFPASSE